MRRQTRAAGQVRAGGRRRLRRSVRARNGTRDVVATSRLKSPGSFQASG